MGTNHSRRMSRTNSSGSGPSGRDEDNSNAEGEDFATEAELQSDIISLIARLIRSEQVHILPNPDDSDEEAEDSDGYSFINSYVVRPHAVSGKPDTSVIDSSDFKQQVLAHSGRLRRTGAPRRPDIPHMLMSGPLLASMNTDPAFQFSLLPDTSDIVDRYQQKAFCGVYSEDGNTFLTASQDQYVRIYDTSCDRFRLEKKIRARDVGWSIIDTAYSPDGRKFIYSSWSDYVHICNLHGDYDNHRALDMSPTDDRFCIFSLEFTKDNREFIGGANDGFLYIYDLEQDRRTSRIEAHEDDVQSVALADETSQIVYSSGDDGLIKVWDRRTLNETSPVPVGILAGHADGITYIDSKGDARYLLSNCKDQSMKLWDIRKFSSKEAQELTKHMVRNQTWDYRWQKYPDKVRHDKNLEGDTSLMTYRGHSILHTLIRCHFSPMHTTGQRYVYTGCATGCIVVYDALTGEKVKVIKAHRACTRDVTWHPHRPIIMSASWDCTVRKSYVRRTCDSDEDDSDSEDDSDREPGRKWSRRRGGRLRQLRDNLRFRVQ